MDLNPGQITVHITATVDRSHEALAAQAVCLGDCAKRARTAEEARDYAAAACDLAEASKHAYCFLF